jgi:hypothetical protein
LLGEVRYVDAFGHRRETRMRAYSNPEASVEPDFTMALEWDGIDNDAT